AGGAPGGAADEEGPTRASAHRGARIDDWQCRGVGTRLLDKLLEVARHAGIPRVIGYTFATNEAMKRLARKAGLTVRSDPADASVSILEIDLRAP
ncbi:MAG: GNAT family N-acetyltransferase, partial [Burkholderiaceae bacterium]